MFGPRCAVLAAALAWMGVHSAPAGAAEPFRGLLITEIVLAPVEHEGFELFNANASGEIDLSGVIVTDRQGSAVIEGQAEFPPGTVIGAGEFIWVFTSVSPAFLPDTSILAPGTQVFEDGESGALFEGKPIPGLVNRVDNVSLSDIGDDVTLLAPGTQRPVVLGVNGDAVIDAVFSGQTTFLGANFLLGPDEPVRQGDVGLFAREGTSLQRLPTDQDTDVVVADFALSGLTAGRPLEPPTVMIDPLTSALVADGAGTGDLTLVRGLPGSPEIAGRVISRAIVSEGAISPDGDTALTLDPQRSILGVLQGLTGGTPLETSVRTGFDEGAGTLLGAVRFASDGTRATVAHLGNDTLTTYLGLPGNPTPAGVVQLPAGQGPEDMALSPVDPELAVAVMTGLGRAFVARGLTHRAPEVIGVFVGAGANGVAITRGGDRAIVANTLADSLTVIDGLTGTPRVAATLKSPEVGAGPQAVAISPVGDVGLVTNSFGDSVTVLTDLEAARPRSVVTLPTGAFPAGVAFLPDGATAVVASAVSPGITVIGDLWPKPAAARVVATLFDQRLRSASFAEQAVLTFPPPPFLAYRHDFAEDTGGWKPHDAAPHFEAPSPDTDGGRLGTTSRQPGTTYGGWHGPPGVASLFGGSLHALRVDLASDAPSPAESPAARLRLATRDGSVGVNFLVNSVGDASAAPRPTPEAFWALLALPGLPGSGTPPGAAGGGDLAWDLIHFEEGDAPSRLSAAQVSVLRWPLAALGPAETVAVFEFAGGAEGWRFETVEPHFAAPLGRAVPELLLTEVTGPGQVGFWESPVLARVAADRLVRFSWRVGTDIVPVTRVPMVRLRVFTADGQVVAEQRFVSAGEGLGAAGPLPRVCDTYLVLPQGMRRRGVVSVELRAAFDVIGLDPADAATGTVYLDSLRVETLALPPELRE